MNGWIKLYRKLNENPIMQDQAALQLFIWILTNVDSKTGTVDFGRYFVARELKTNPNTLYSALQRLVSKYKVCSILSTASHTQISLLNWAKYQPTETPVNTTFNSPSTTTQQPINTLQEYKNKEYKNIKRESSQEYLQTFSIEDFSDIDATERQIRLEAEKALNWCLANNRKKSNYKAFLRNWLLKVYKKRSIPTMVIPEDRFTIDPEGIAKVQAMKDKLMGNLKSLN